MKNKKIEAAFRKEKEGNETQSDLLQQIRKIIFPKFQPQDLPNSKIDSSSMKTLAELKDKLTLDPLEFNSELAFTQMLKDNDIAIGDFVIDSNIKKGKILGLLQAVRSYYSVLEEKEKTQVITPETTVPFARQVTFKNMIKGKQNENSKKESQEVSYHFSSENSDNSEEKGRKKKKKEGERGRGRGREGGSERNSSFFEELVQSLGG